MSSQYELGDLEHPHQHRQNDTGIEQHRIPDDDHFDHGQHNAALAGTVNRTVPPVALRTAGPLTTFDVFSFIVNKMVGTGIFTAPSVVLALTADRRIAVTLWGLAFLYTIITMFIYLSFAAVLPYNTGELVYIDEATSSDASPPSRFERSLHFCGNGLLAYTVYAILFVTLFTNGTNTLQLGRLILISIKPEEAPNLDLVRFIGVVCLTTVCLVHYFSTRAGRAANRILCRIKLVSLVVLLGAGAKRAAVGPSIHYPVIAGSPDTSPPFSNYAKALFLVLYSFEGWENASFVAGEIPLIRGHRTLRNGFLWAVAVVGTLYLLLNIVFVYSVDVDGQLPRISADRSFAPQFFEDSPTAITCWSVLAAISATGSLVSVIYTYSRVKQAIGDANILPFSSIWKQDCSEYKNADDDLEKTPKGGLILHWISAVVTIAAIAKVKDKADMMAFPGILQTYAHSLQIFAITIGLGRLRGRAEALDREGEDVGFKWIWRANGPHKWMIAVILCLYALFSLGIIVLYPITSSRGMMPNWVTPTVVLSVLLVGVLYFFLFFWGSTFVRAVDQGDQELEHGNGRRRFSMFRYARIQCIVSKVDQFDPLNDEKARRFGSRRTISYQPSEETKFWYLIFRGTRVDTTLSEAITWRWRDIRHSLGGLFARHGTPTD